MIRVGPAGWSYADWEGRIHARPSARASPATSPAHPAAHPLDGLLEVFACVEVNVTFYRDPTAAMQEAWLERLAGHADARLPIKLHQRFTHASKDTRDELTRELEAWSRALAPWGVSPQRGPLLVQFPFSFAPGPAERRYLRALLDGLNEVTSRLSGPASSPVDTVVELRRREWFERALRDELLGTGASLVGIDLPAHRAHPDLDTMAAGPVGYMRFHGRNAATWFDRDATRDQRYDHLYTTQEIDVLAARIRRRASETDDVYVVMNNHFEGKAVANGVELLAALGTPPRRLPAHWVEHFPRLAAIAPTFGQGHLF